MKRRGGFTILEMVLVLAVIVMLSAMAYPTMAGWFKSEKLKTATDTIREAIALARHLAIEEGEPYRLCIVEGGGNLRAAPDRDEFWTGGTGDDSEEHEDSLPNGVVVSIDHGVSDGEFMDFGDRQTAQEVGAVNPSSWVQVAVFFPDGRADTDATLMCEGLGVRSIIIHLRALTGTSAVER